MLIDVTLKDIANGSPQDECNCPIALAVTRAARYELPDDCKHPNVISTVHESSIEIFYDNGTEIDFQFRIIPEDIDDWSLINDFISRFDNGKEVEPFDMEFDVIQD